MDKRQVICEVAATEEVGPGIFLVALRPVDGETAFEPAQFIFLKPVAGEPPLLRRPFGILDVVDGCARILFDVRGSGTRALAGMRVGDSADALYPLGTGFPLPTGDETPVLVAGGMGLAPVHSLAVRLKELGRSFVLVYGARSAAQLVLKDQVAALGDEVRLCTDDGSCGHHGLVTELLPAPEVGVHFYACGPDPMMAAVARHAGDRPCHVSLEERMACGVGVCMGCVTMVQRPGGGRRFERICVEGPVFDARELVWS